MDNEVREMYEKTEKLPGLDLFVNLNFDVLSKEDQQNYILAANEYMTKLTAIANKIQKDEDTIMCHEIVFDTTEVLDPYDRRWLKEYPLYLTKYVYAPIPKSWLGRRIRELNKWMQVFIPDPKGILSQDMATEQAMTDAQEYIDRNIRIYKEWEDIRRKF